MSYEEMKKAADEHQGSIELRSEKVRNIIGQMPPFLIRWGNTILAVILVLLTACFMQLSSLSQSLDQGHSLFSRTYQHRD